MQSKPQSKIFFALIILVSLGVLGYIAKSVASDIPAPTVTTADVPEQASSSDMSSAAPALSSAAAPSAAVTPDPYATVSIHVPKGSLTALVASTSDQQTLGLGDRDSLPADEGMIFPFAYPGDYGFWMKDMRFSLDMVWILPNKKVAGITGNISADSYPTVFFPPGQISYVLELDAGQAAKLGIATGTQLVF